MAEVAVKSEINAWIVSAALAGANEIDILAGICERINAAGVSLVRASVAGNVLDPTFDAHLVRWLRDQGGVEEPVPRTDDPASVGDWKWRPFAFFVEGGHGILRRRLDATYCRGEFPMLDRFQTEGVTDYV